MAGIRGAHGGRELHIGFWLEYVAHMVEGNYV